MAAAAAQLLGEDGRGYELARLLEACGAWRAWLGDDAAHAALAQHLSSPSTWDAFLSPAPPAAASPPRPLLLLQLRVRALLFDKASAALLLSRGAGPHSVNANYLQLHGDDIYFSLEHEHDDNTKHQMHSRTAFSPTRDGSMLSQRRNRYDELSDTWYKQFAEKVRTWRSKYHSGDKEIPMRTAEGMSNYLKVCSVHKRKRTVFLEGQGPSISSPMLENGPSSTDETFIPEIIFPSDCVPESAIPRTNGISRTDKIEVHGVLDNLPAPVSHNTAMLERFGMMPEYYKTGNKYRGKDGSRAEGKSLSHEQALLMIQKLVARFLANSGFESGTAASIDVLSEIIIKHICKLGSNLKLLTDSYRKQFSSIELLKMFLQAVGHSNIGPLMEVTKTGNRVVNYPVHQDAQVLQSQNQNSLLHAQQIVVNIDSSIEVFPFLKLWMPGQICLQYQFRGEPNRSLKLPRQFPPQMTIHTQHLTPQQQQLLQQQQWRRNHMTSPRGPLTMADRNQPLVNVKIENTTDSQIDGGYGTLSAQQKLQLRHHQLLQQQRQQLQQQQLQQQQQQLQLNQQQQQLQQQQQQLNKRQQQLNQQQEQQHFQQQHFQQQQQQQQMAMPANQNAQLAQQFKQAPSMSAYGMRMPPVKVEAFHELVSGDSSLKHDNDPNKLTSPK